MGDSQLVGTLPDEAIRNVIQIDALMRMASPETLPDADLVASLDCSLRGAVMTTWLFERSGYPARHVARYPCPEHWKALAAMHHLIRVAEEHSA